MTWPIRAMNGAIPVVVVWRRTPSRCGRRARPAGRGRPCAGTRARPASAGRARAGWSGGGGRGPGWRAWRPRQDAVARPGRLALPVALVEAEDERGFGGEVRVAGEDPGLVLPRLDRVLGQDAAHTGRRDRADQARSGQLGS